MLDDCGGGAEGAVVWSIGRDASAVYPHVHSVSHLCAVMRMIGDVTRVGKSVINSWSVWSNGIRFGDVLSNERQVCKTEG